MVILGRVFITGIALLAALQASAETTVPQEDAIASLTKLVEQVQLGQEHLAQGQSAIATVLTYLKNIRYATDESCTITEPVTGISCTATWGFAASGDCFMPLPACAISMRTTTKGQAPTFENFAINLVKTKALATAQETSGLVDLIKDLKTNPVSLVAFKLILLFKDHYNNRAYIQQELTRLVLRLSITTLPTSTLSTIPLSERLPADMTKLLTMYTPEVLDVMDAGWQAITSNETLELPDVHIQALVFTDQELAQKIMQEFQHATTAEEIQEAIGCRGIMALDLANLRLALKRTPTVTIPAKAPNPTHTICSLVTATNELPEAASSITEPGVSLVEADDLHWLLVATNQLSPVQAVAALTTTLLASFKRFITARAAYLDKHPEAVLARKAAEQAHKSNAQLVAAFLTTPQGQEAQKSLAGMLDIAIKTYRPATTPRAEKTEAEQKLAQHTALKTQEKTFIARGQSVPEAVTAAIATLEKTLPILTQQATYAPLALTYAPLAHGLAGLHEHAAHKVLESIAAHERALTARLATITDAPLRLIAENDFKLMLEAPGKAYADQLIKQAALIRTRTMQIKELAQLRALAANGTLDGNDTSSMHTYGLLEVTVGNILDARTQESFAELLVKAPSTLESFKQDIVNGDPAYANINTETLDALALILKRSPHLRYSNNELLTQALALVFPAAVPMYKHALAAAQAVV